MKPPRPCIALVHALRDSITPVRAAFTTHWPEAEIFNVLDDSLSSAASASGAVSDEVASRLLGLAQYAAAGFPGRRPDGMLITSSAFGKAIEAAKRELTIPVMGPYEATFEAALDRARHIGLLVTFSPSLNALVDELHQTASRRGLEIEIRSQLVDGALTSLQSGDVAGHNEAIANAASQFVDCDLIILGQFSMAQAVAAMSADLARRVLTTPAGAVKGLRKALFCSLDQ